MQYRNGGKASQSSTWNIPCGTETADQATANLNAREFSQEVKIQVAINSVKTNSLLHLSHCGLIEGEKKRITTDDTKIHVAGILFNFPDVLKYIGAMIGKTKATGNRDDLDAAPSQKKAGFCLLYMKHEVY